MTKSQRQDARFAPEMLLASKALAHPLRLSILELLEQRPRRFGELTQATQKTPGTLSPHLRQLQKGGLVSKSIREVGAEIRDEYTLSRFGQRVLLGWDQAFGIPVPSTLRVTVSSAGSERMDDKSLSERSSIGSTFNIPLEV